RARRAHAPLRAQHLLRDQAGPEGEPLAVPPVPTVLGGRRRQREVVERFVRPCRLRSTGQVPPRQGVLHPVQPAPALISGSCPRGTPRTRSSSRSAPARCAPRGGPIRPP